MSSRSSALVGGHRLEAQRIGYLAEQLGERWWARGAMLADYQLPSFDGLSALELALSERHDLPFIFVSGTLGEEVAIEALKIAEERWQLAIEGTNDGIFDWNLLWYPIEPECLPPNGRYFFPAHCRMTMVPKIVMSKKGIERVSFLPAYIKTIGIPLFGNATSVFTTSG